MATTDSAGTNIAGTTDARTYSGKNDKYGYPICFAGSFPNCFTHFFKAPSPDYPELQKATDAINRTLEKVAKENPNPNRELAILAFRDVDGKDYLRLAYISVSEPVTS